MYNIVHIHPFTALHVHIWGTGWVIRRLIIHQVFNSMLPSFHSVTLIFKIVFPFLKLDPWLTDDYSFQYLDLQRCLTRAIGPGGRQPSSFLIRLGSNSKTQGFSIYSTYLLATIDSYFFLIIGGNSFLGSLLVPPTSNIVRILVRGKGS